MAISNIPYLKWRAGRPRWEPGPALRKAGWKGFDLKDDNGEWMTRGAAIDAAEKQNAKVAAWRTGNSLKERPTKAPVSESRTVEALFEVYFQSPRFQRLSQKTQRDYRNKARNFCEIFGPAHVAAVQSHHLETYWEQQIQARGHAMANGIIAVARAAFTHARRIGWRTNNPAKALGLTAVKPRLVIWTPKEITHMVETADQMGLASVADAFILALHSGQRQGDVLAMPDRIFDDRIRLTQFKRGALIDAPMTPQLRERITMIRARKRRQAVINLDALVIYEGTGKPYTSDLFQKKFSIVRRRAAQTMPSIKGKKFMDLRDTAVTRLAMADCTIPQICSITGHSEKTAHQIMRHYLALNANMADAAIDKLVAWMRREGIAI